jgi:hypothetical protein
MVALEFFKGQSELAITGLKKLSGPPLISAAFYDSFLDVNNSVKFSKVSLDLLFYSVHRFYLQPTPDFCFRCCDQPASRLHEWVGPPLGLANWPGNNSKGKTTFKVVTDQQWLMCFSDYKNLHM